MILTVLIFIVLTIVLAYIDAEHINDQDYIESKASRNIQRGLIILGFSLSQTLLLDKISLGLLLISIFWVLFDYTLNYFRKLPFFYLGTEGSDKFWKDKPKLQLAAKLVFLTITLWIFLN